METKKILTAIANGTKQERQKAAATLSQPKDFLKLTFGGAPCFGITWSIGSEIVGATIFKTGSTERKELTPTEYTDNFSSGDFIQANLQWIGFKVPPGTTNKTSDPIE